MGNQYLGSDIVAVGLAEYYYWVSFASLDNSIEIEVGRNTAEFQKSLQ